MIIDISAGGPSISPSKGDTLRLGPGVHKPFVVRAQDVTIECLPGARVVGGRTGSGEPPSTLRGMDGAHGLTLLGGEWTGSRGRGIRITGSERVRVEGVKSHGHAIEAMILGDCPGARIIACDLGDHAGAAAGYAPDRCHALYISRACDNTVVEDCRLHDVPGAGLQINAATREDGEHVARGLQVRRVVLERCGSDGTGAFSLMGVCDSLFEEFYCRLCRGLGTLFADGRAGSGCVGNTFRRYSVETVTVWSHFRELEGSGGNTFVLAPGWKPAAPAPIALIPLPEVAAGTKLCPTCRGTGVVAAAPGT